ncbi:hypothetical protein LCGC14_2823960, partial [marine sediment metagenome]
FNTADSQEISVTLDDTDGKIKAVMDENDVHMRDVWVYQWFEGLDIADRFLLFKGKVNSPIIWNEGERTVSFTILAQIEDNEVGFSPEEGEISNLPRSLVGKPWPMVFGTVTHSKALHLTNRLRGTTAIGVGFPDFALPSRMFALHLIGQFTKKYLHVTANNTHLLQAAEIAEIIKEQSIVEMQSIMQATATGIDRLRHPMAVMARSPTRLQGFCNCSRNRSSMRCRKTRRLCFSIT